MHDIEEKNRNKIKINDNTNKATQLIKATFSYICGAHQRDAFAQFIQCCFVAAP